MESWRGKKSKKKKASTDKGTVETGGELRAKGAVGHKCPCRGYKKSAKVREQKRSGEPIVDQTKRGTNPTGDRTESETKPWSSLKKRTQTTNRGAN